ncbi:ATP-binding domain-containing protein [Methanoregula sp.]|uniref:DEAD/DEAH box helicase n=1 Tax=Methanoregula sp. TaxID=2052170 RepID=UPI00236A5F25|nr:ATP-binding domain-containing protein [Methanoregula sp.]MDD1686412.1 ATP-binding domain-containing protein [Methanoregula sp.]
MIELVVTLPKYGSDVASQHIWLKISTAFPELNGVCYYMHPILKTRSGVVPDFTLLTQSHQPVVIRCLPYQIDEIKNLNEKFWIVNNEEIDSPIQEAGDFVFLLKSKFGADRDLRKRLEPYCILALPSITKKEFESKFPNTLNDTLVIWKDSDINTFLKEISPRLTDVEWRLTRSIIQGINPLTKGGGLKPKPASTLGEAIKSIDSYIALLDDEQEKAALQIAPGPQRIRGMAGTGKTVLLAMKAAQIHQRFPEKRILFTFNTQSLYNQIRTLITKFYRFHSDSDPDWDYLHIRHAWGGPRRSGVYYDTCRYLGVPSLPFFEAKRLNWKSPFVSCCKHILSKEIDPMYDYIMVDEAQDFPSEFFQLLFNLTPTPHNIYWVYDELQSLFGEKIPSPEELFGVDKDGKPNVTLEGEAYPGGIEKDFILHRSYRCTQPVLMLAHAIGLGLYSPDGPVQMLSKKESWEAFGYKIEHGDLVKDSKLTIFRPKENSPNPINDVYKGSQEIITSQIFEDRDKEFDWIARSIYNDITVEKVLPEHIIVICLDPLNMKKYLPPIQERLYSLGLQSAIPGLVDDSSAFAEDGRVTLSTVLRAKGNESYIVYVFSFDVLYDYVESLQNRNRAFTAITRSKAWVRISGIGPGMKKAKSEIDKILSDQPKFNFIFPDMEKIRDLDAEIARRKRDIRKARDNLTGLTNVDLNALIALSEQDPDLFESVIKKIEEVTGKRESK